MVSLSPKFLKVQDSGGGVVHLRLNRPPANAVDFAMYCEIADVFRNIDRVGNDVRVVILSGEGRHFCAGNDLEEFATMTPENGAERMWRVREAFFAISECRVPVIGAIHGAALGTGLVIAASCDFVVASEEARFGLPELTVGVMGGARHLARLCHQPVVRRMFFSGEHLSARQLAEAGGAISVCKPDEYMKEAERIAARIAGFSPTAVQVAKRVLDRVEWMNVREGYEFEQAATVRMSGHPDSKEALLAFQERRDPRYASLSEEKKWYGV